MSENNLITVKELAAKLEVTDLLLKKLIKFFEIPNRKIKRSMYLDESGLETVKKIVELKAAGKRNKDIKQLFDEQKKREQKKVSEPADVKSEEVKAPEQNSEEKSNAKVEEISDTNRVESKTEEEKIVDQSDDIQSNIEESDPDTKEENKISTRPNKRKKSLRKPKSKDDQDSDAKETEVHDKNEKKPSEPDYVKSYTESEEQEAKYAVEQHDPIAEALALDEEDEENASDLEDFDDFDEEEDLSKDSISPRKIKRKAFSFRYIQRQIASDTKKVNFLKNKLKKGKLSHLERLNLKDSLDRRAKMLSSWIQILRWVKS